MAVEFIPRAQRPGPVLRTFISIENEVSDYRSRNNCDARIGESSEALAQEAFQRMNFHLDPSMRTAGILEGWNLTDYQSEYKPKALVLNPES